MTFRQATEAVRGPAEYAELLTLLREAGAVWTLGPDAVRWEWRCAANLQDGSRQIEALVQAAAQTEPLQPFMQAYQAWALAKQERFQEAQALAEQALSQEAQLLPAERRLAYRTLARSLLMLGADSSWEEAAKEALRDLKGMSRGLTLLDLGAALSHQGKEAQAMGLFSEALPLLSGHPAYQAWTLNNMGTVCLRLAQLEEAETFYSRSSRLNTPHASRALSGLAAARRAFGEWPRAASLYDQAARLARRTGDEDDLRQALRGLGHTWRLAGQVTRALEPLHAAAVAVEADRTSGYSWVHVDLAAAYSSWPPHGAELNETVIREFLSRTGPLGTEDQGRATLVQAEGLRRADQPDAARDLLGTLHQGGLWIREEAHAFPELFALLPDAERPQPLPRSAQLRVSLRVLGVPEVQVGGRAVSLSAAPLLTLCALVEARGSLTAEALAEVVRDHMPRSARQAGQRVSAAVRQVRAALGWEGSVISRDRAYHLDQSVQWTSDVLDALRKGQTIEAYCTGIHLPWATEREQHLRQGDSEDWR
ncbi:tetratricopeptide repeat protein [Deinococcus sp. HMF7604]|uniref:tetratricopeptide repeat protein n=1 Tax=Deinococcus betulae TaxID=2873312 RepID=UPI001CCC5719|nr:tetratricopeptide repeat protein [Deinococcus betulae]MBZ9751889.1 tetratricopeptide repeat protein [Deinococcus betulae]